MRNQFLYACVTLALFASNVAGLSRCRPYLNFPNGSIAPQELEFTGDYGRVSTQFIFPKTWEGCEKQETNIYHVFTEYQAFDACMVNAFATEHFKTKEVEGRIESLDMCRVQKILASFKEMLGDNYMQQIIESVSCLNGFLHDEVIVPPQTPGSFQVSGDSAAGGSGNTEEETSENTSEVIVDETDADTEELPGGYKQAAEEEAATDGEEAAADGEEAAADDEEAAADGEEAAADGEEAAADGEEASADGEEAAADGEEAAADGEEAVTGDGATAVDGEEAAAEEGAAEEGADAEGGEEAAAEEAAGEEAAAEEAAGEEAAGETNDDAAPVDAAIDIEITGEEGPEEVTTVGAAARRRRRQRRQRRQRRM